ncbi:RNA ligase RtcB family protein [Desulfonema ishimotonii]|uniref:3'-phosphate/5'-hydroxy nucleic acid ligase n=1 Tax=Desulfonema ishimotonii TaxID=45657 RepID=A0A401FT21_9BACT|nr:RNA ligase RtcB family protein [Desulfonema ishimotonii]GBC60115.1 RNA ligase RtcB family protein [Desulfonema ishimotonii]
MIIISKENPVIRLFTEHKNRIEGDALHQLKKSAELPGMQTAVGMPDLHPGNGGPVGAAFITHGIFYPHLIGSDVGCGMGLWQTNLRKNKVKRDKWARKLSGFETPWEGDAGEWLTGYNLNPSQFENALGTIGGGNHFAELQTVEKISDPEAFGALGLDKKHLMVLVHSGSRGLGASILRHHTDKHGAGGLEDNTDDATDYLKAHDEAIQWAEANRALIAHRFISALGTIGERVLDLSHNAVSRIQHDGQTLWLHRKGAAPSDRGPVIIPGTRGSLTYLVRPLKDQSANAWSLAHGAGRKWNRGSVRARLKSRYTPASLSQTDMGSLVICEDRDLLYEEAPQAYKNIDGIIRDMEASGLIRQVATFRPLITYKVRKNR